MNVRVWTFGQLRRVILPTDTALRGTLTVDGPAGTNTLALPGRIDGKLLSKARVVRARKRSRG